MKAPWILLLLTAAAAAQTAPPTPAAAQKKAAAPGRRTAAQAPAVPSYKDLQYPAPKPIPIPPVQTVTLAGGIRLYLLEDHELPLITGSARVRTGNLFDPADKVGLAAMTGIVMRTGGTGKQTGDEIDQALENVAASVESEIGESSGSVSFSTLKENIDPVLAVFHDVLTSPEFSQDRIDLAKTQLHSSIARRNDNPASILQREFSDMLYGNRTPYGWRMEHATVDAITRTDLKAFYQRYFFPSNVRLAVWGDFDSAAMKEKIEKLFADWTRKQEPVPDFPKVTAAAAPGTFLAPKGGTAQTFFAMGHLGGVLSDKDYAALEIMAGILGGGAQSRLFRQVRTRMGNAYDISAAWDANYDHPGLLEISGSTKGLSTVETILAVRKEVEGMRASEVTEEELRAAKETALNRLVFAFDTRTKTLARMLTYDYYGYPMDFMQQYQKALENVTRADVLRVAKARLDPDSFTLIAVGNPDTFDQPLDKLGKPVSAIDLTIAPPGKPTADSTTTSLARQILARAQQAAGSVEKLMAVKDFTQASEFWLAHAAGGLHVKARDRWIGPGYFRQDSELPSGKISAYFDGNQGWISTPQGDGPLAGLQLSQLQGALFRLYFRLLLSDRLPGRTVIGTGPWSVDILSSAGDTVHVAFSSATGLPKSFSYEAVHTTGPALQVEETFGDFRYVDGIMVPFRITITQGSADFAEVTVTEVKFNSGLKAADLEQKPAVAVQK